MKKIHFFKILLISFFCMISLFGGGAKAFAWDPYFTAYYGTSNTTDYNTAAANWTGGNVYRDGYSNYQLGTSSYLQNQSGSSGTKDFIVVPDPGYKITSVKWCEATWTNANSITWTGSWNTVSGLSTNQTSTFNFSFYAAANKKYLIWVTFAPVGVTGGQVGAWYGTNNTTGYNTPAANGSGGEVWKTTNIDSRLNNGVADGYDNNGNVTRTFQVRPASGFRIVSINVGVSLSPSTWTPISVSASQTTNVSFTIDIENGNQYVIWVVFASTAASSFTVSGTVDPTTDASCGTSSISPTSQIVNINQTGTFSLNTGSSCQVESVNFNSQGTTLVGVSGLNYITPQITANSSFVVKFRPVGYTINASVDTSSPSGCGSISPVGAAVAVTQGGSQTFSITVNSGCSISHVYVTDPDKSYSNLDVAPLANNSYTFNNVQANGSIRVVFVASVPASGNDYCQIPPFVQGQTGLAPNVLIIFDNSGSMGGNDSDGYAYKDRPGKSYDCTSSHTQTSNPCPTIYYGYFNPYKMYKTDASNSNVYVESGLSLNLSSSNGLSGNYLNYILMKKVDVMRKILVGGRVTDKGSTTLAGTSRATLTTKYLRMDNGKWVVYGSDEPVGLVQNLSNRVRFGLEVFGSDSSSTSDGGRIIAKLGSSVADLVSGIEGSATNPTTNTPIAEALYEASRYFQAKPSAYNDSTNYGDSTWNPSSNPIIQYTCQKNFVLLLTDGESNSADKLPGLSTNPSKNSYTDTVFNVVTWRDRIAAADLPSTNDGRYVVSVGYYNHVTDLRSSTYSNDMLGNQNLTFYSVYAFGDGTGTKTLQMLSKYGAFENKNGNSPSPNTYPSPDQAAEWDKDSNSIPDTYFEGDDGTILENSILAALNSILAKVASGTAASILSNSEGSGANLLQAVFYPNKIFQQQTEVNWIGEMQNLWYYVDPFAGNSTVREDTDFSTTTPSHIMNLVNDYVVDFQFDGNQTIANVGQDTNGDGKAEVTINSTQDPDEVKSIWRAGKLLWARTPATRTILTSTTGASFLTEEVSGKGGFFWDSGHAVNAASLQTFLQAADLDESKKIISYIRGTDPTPNTYRNRKVSLLTAPSTYTVSEWKLGDIISSTPRIQSTGALNTYNVAAPSGYSDTSYAAFIGTDNYKNRGMVYVGANDGMMHAFKLGKLSVSGSGISGHVKAILTGTNLGEEQWAYIPRNVLPYLKYFTDRENYKHLYYVDGPTTVADVAIAKPTGCDAGLDYSACVKDSTAGTNWRTVLIGSMGLGGASALKDSASCASGASGTCVKTPIVESTDATKGIGYSSYFALDITNQYFNSDGTLANQPTLKWEFAPPGLGYSTSGAAIIRVGTTGDYPVHTKNGKWFAVMASGPTGPIDTVSHQFIGKSDQNLKIFVVDLGATGALVENTNYWVLDTGITRAFGGSVLPGMMDADRWNKTAAGNYSDDVLYVGYSKANIADSTAITAATKWTDGGIIRILTKEDTNPAHWVVSKVISGIGPVNNGIMKLQDRKNHKLWLYFGTGRFFHSGDDVSSIRYLMGVQEGCYLGNDTINPNCDTTTGISKSMSCTVGSNGVLSGTDCPLVDQSTSISSLDPNPLVTTDDKRGWYVRLPGEETANNLSAHRSVTDAVAISSGMVLFTSFAPTSDVCKFGGETRLWSLRYDTGGLPLCASLKGKVMVQMSTGSFQQQNLSDIFACDTGSISTPGPTKQPTISPPSGYVPPTAPGGGNYSAPPSQPIPGKPPVEPPTYIYPGANTPMKKVIHIQEK